MSHTAGTEMSTDTVTDSVTQQQERHIDMGVLQEIFDTLESMRSYFDSRHRTYSDKDSYGYEQMSLCEDCYFLALRQHDALFCESGPDYEALDNLIEDLLDMARFVSGGTIYDGLGGGRRMRDYFSEEFGGIEDDVSTIVNILLPKLEPQVEGQTHTVS
jgi:hypothetical protein